MHQAAKRVASGGCQARVSCATPVPSRLAPAKERDDRHHRLQLRPSEKVPCGSRSRRRKALLSKCVYPLKCSCIRCAESRRESSCYFSSALLSWVVSGRASPELANRVSLSPKPPLASFSRRQASLPPVSGRSIFRILFRFHPNFHSCMHPMYPVSTSSYSWCSLKICLPLACLTSMTNGNGFRSRTHQVC